MSDHRVIATRGDNEQYLVKNDDDPQGTARIYDTQAKRLSPEMPFQTVLKQGYWRQHPPKKLRDLLGKTAGDGVKPPDPTTHRYPRMRPYPRWGSREGIDPTTHHDGGLHAGALGEQKLEKALAPLLPSNPPPAGQTTPTQPPAPTRVRQPLPTSPAPPTATPGATFHFHPETGMTSYGPHPLFTGQRPAAIGDHVALRPKGAGEFGEMGHARVVGLLSRGGVRVRHTATGKEENLLGPQTARGMQMAPGARYGRELPPEVRIAHNRDMADTAEDGLDTHHRPMDLRRDMNGGPEVGMRFREIAAHGGAWQDGHPFGDMHEVVHVYPSGRSLVTNRANGDIAELHADDWHNAMRHDSFRPETGNWDDEHADHEAFAKAGALLHPEEAPHNDHAEEDDAAAEDLPTHAVTRARLAAGRLRGLTDGAHGIQHVVDAYTTQHGPLRSEVTDILHDAHTGDVEVRGKIHHRDDQTGEERAVGHFARTLGEDDQQNLVAKHNWLELPAKHQGAGFAQAFNDRAEDHYKQMGVHRAELHADISVGKYAWAQQGYDFQGKKHRAEVWDAFKKWTDDNGYAFPKRDYDKFRKTGTAWDMANYDPMKERIHVRTQNPYDASETHVDGHFHLGKAFLLSNASGGGWHGEKLMSGSSPHQQQAEKYRAKQRSKGKIKSFGQALWLKAKGQPAPPPPPPARDKAKLPRRKPFARAMEGRGPVGVQDAWYHGAWLLAHDPQVARGIVPNGGRLGTLQKSALPDEPRRVAHPGARGGHWWYDQRGEVRYGPHPLGSYHRAAVGDHVTHNGAHAFVTQVAHNGDMALRYAHSTREHAVEPGDPAVTQMAPATRYGNELPPGMEENYAALGLSEDEENGPEDADPRRQRELMRDEPQAGDRLALREPDTGELTHLVVKDSEHGRDVVLAPHGAPDDESIMDWADWQKFVMGPRVRVVRRDDDDAQPGDAPRDDPRTTQPFDTSPYTPPSPLDDLRAAMAGEAHVDDEFQVLTSFVQRSLGAEWQPGTYSVAAAGSAGVEVINDQGRTVADMNDAEYAELINHPACKPLRQGDRRDEDGGDVDPDEYMGYDDPSYNPLEHLRGDALVEAVLPGVTEDDLRAAWDGDLPGGFTTEIDSLEPHTEHEGFHLEGTIYQHGEPIGEFWRSVYTNGDGYTEIHHDLMQFGSPSMTLDQSQTIAAKLGASGFAAAFNERAEALYKGWGIDLISVQADISIGKYVWARQGYDFDTRHYNYRKSTADKMIAYAEKRGLALSDGDKAYLRHPERHAWEMAEFAPEGQPKIAVQAYQYTPTDGSRGRYSDDYGHWNFLVDGEFALGRAYLLEDHFRYTNEWYGLKYLDDSHPTQVQSRKYAGGKKGK